MKDFNQNTRNASQEEKISGNLHGFPADSGLKASQPFMLGVRGGGFIPLHKASGYTETDQLRESKTSGN